MIKIQKKNFSLSEVNKKLLKKNSGAIVTFIGIVRGEKKTKKKETIGDAPIAATICVYLGLSFFGKLRQPNFETRFSK